MISDEIEKKVNSGEVPILTIRDPSVGEEIVLKAIFGNRPAESPKVTQNKTIDTDGNNSPMPAIITGFVSIILLIVILGT